MYKWTTALQWRVAALKAVFFFYFDFYAFILYAVVKIFFWEILISSFFSNLLFNPNKFSQLPLLLCAFSSIAGGITCVAYMYCAEIEVLNFATNFQGCKKRILLIKDCFHCILKKKLHVQNTNMEHFEFAQFVCKLFCFFLQTFLHIV